MGEIFLITENIISMGRNDSFKIHALSKNEMHNFTEQKNILIGVVYPPVRKMVINHWLRAV